MSQNNGNTEEQELFRMPCHQEKKIRNIEEHLEDLVVRIEKQSTKMDVMMDDTASKFMKIENHLNQLNNFLIAMMDKIKDL